MTKITPGWGQGDKAPKTVEGAPPKGRPNAPTPHFVPVKAPGSPKAGDSTVTVPA